MTKIVDLRTATRIPAPADQEPAFETTLTETLAIRKFLEMSIADIKAQLERSARDGTPRKTFLAQKQNAFVITAWLTSALMTVDSMLGEAAMRAETPLAEQIKETG